MLQLHSQPSHVWLLMGLTVCLMCYTTQEMVDCRVQTSKAHLHQSKRAKAAKGSLWDPHSVIAVACHVFPNLSCGEARQSIDGDQSTVVLQTATLSADKPEVRRAKSWTLEIAEAWHTRRRHGVPCVLTQGATAQLQSTLHSTA